MRLVAVTADMAFKLACCLRHDDVSRFVGQATVADGGNLHQRRGERIHCFLRDRLLEEKGGLVRWSPMVLGVRVAEHGSTAAADCFEEHTEIVRAQRVFEAQPHCSAAELGAGDTLMA